MTDPLAVDVRKLNELTAILVASIRTAKSAIANQKSKMD